MRKIIASSLVVLAALAMGTADAGHGARSVEGTILVPTVTVPTQGTFSRQARCAYLAGQEAATDTNGLFGWVIELEGSEGDGNHAFTLSSDSANAGVAFYESLGTCDNGPPAVVTGQFFNAGNESGTIPAASTIAIVVIEDGADAAFTFSVA